MKLILDAKDYSGTEWKIPLLGYLPSIKSQKLFIDDKPFDKGYEITKDIIIFSETKSLIITENANAYLDIEFTKNKVNITLKSINAFLTGIAATIAIIIGFFNQFESVFLKFGNLLSSSKTYITPPQMDVIKDIHGLDSAIMINSSICKGQSLEPIDYSVEYKYYLGFCRYDIKFNENFNAIKFDKNLILQLISDKLDFTNDKNVSLLENLNKIIPMKGRFECLKNKNDDGGKLITYAECQMYLIKVPSKTIFKDSTLYYESVNDNEYGKNNDISYIKYYYNMNNNIVDKYINKYPN
jgi:hypothetical protein